MLLANTYDGAGMRAVKTASDGTVYFLDDASGQPLIEETYSASPTPTTTLSKVDAWGADGLRERYTLADGSETSFFYDPQGTLVNRIASVDSGVAVNGEPMTDVSVWDGYGQQRSDQWTNMTVDHQYTPSDPVGFEGQAGYYQDWELSQTSSPGTYVYLRSVPMLLTHRYYDASTGRFVSRDPIGYGGGANLYAYCGGNPITNSDPEGTDDGDNVLPSGKESKQFYYGGFRHAVNTGSGVAYQGLGLAADSLPGMNYFEAVYGRDSIGRALSPGMRMLLAAPILAVALHGAAPALGWLAENDRLFARAHTIAKHVNQSDFQLAWRLMTDTSIDAASTFSSHAIAEDVVGITLAAYQTRIARWVARGARGNLTLDYVGVTKIGRTLVRGGGVRDATDATVVLTANGSQSGHWYILTAYPH